MFFTQKVPGKKVSRQRVIALQIKYIFEKITPRRPVTRVLSKGIIQNRWIYKLEIQAYTEKELVMGRLVIEIDWATFLRNQEILGNSVLVPMDQENNEERAIWNVEEAARLFLSFIKKHALQTRWMVYTEKDVNDPKTYQRLGISKTKLFPWGKGKKKVLFHDSPKNLTEMSLLIEAVEP